MMYRAYTAASLPAVLAEAVQRFTDREGQRPAELCVHPVHGPALNARADWDGVPIREDRAVPRGGVVCWAGPVPS
jgi:hypothetical protein